jgi:hypothetical protein
VVLGTDNGTDLVVDQFHNAVAPANTQTLALSTSGTQLTVTASQTGTQQWKYTTTSGSGYVPFVPAQTASTYTPVFNTPGTYYVVCVSKNQYNDSVTSNEVEVDVQNGTTISTLSVSGSPFYVSDSAHVQVAVSFTSNAVFGAGNVFTAELSDNTGSFASPVTIGTLTSTTVAAVQSVIPNNTPAGTGYRIRVVSSNPAITGTDNGTDLEVIPFSIHVSPLDTQTIVKDQNGTSLVATSTHPSSTFDWQNSQASGIGYIEFNPVQHADTWVPNFHNVGTYYVICKVTNPQHATLTSPEMVVIVTDVSSVPGVQSEFIKAYWDGNDFVVDLTSARLTAPVVQLMNVSGQIVASQRLTNSDINRLSTSLPQGVYVFCIADGANSYTGKTAKR